ncbi:MAG: NADase-type glycan-binding domain-containing protein [Mycobacteriaceae bacterium]
MQYETAGQSVARMQYEMAADPGTYPEALERLWEMAPHLRQLISDNPSCPPHLRAPARSQTVAWDPSEDRNTPSAPPNRSEGRNSRKGVWVALSALGLVVVVAVTSLFLVSWFSTSPQSAADSSPRPAAAGPTATAAGATTTAASGPAAAVQPSTGKATCVARPAQDSSGAVQRYDVSNAFDGDNNTAWRCDGAAEGVTLEFVFPGPVHLRSLGLVPGYDKVDPVDGTDRFAQGRTILQARWEFDGSSMAVDPNGARGMFRTPVDVTTTKVRLVIAKTAKGVAAPNKRGVAQSPVDTTAISEVEFLATS